MTNQDERPLTDARQKAGHYEILGETDAKFEFFENGWNPYSRFLDVDKVDFILRRRTAIGQRIYREVQLKFGKLYPVGSAWERKLFDFSSWRFFKEDEFASQIHQEDFFIVYILARDIGYNRDIFIFPVRDFARAIRLGIPSKGQRKVYISRVKGDSERWVLRKAPRSFSEITEENCLDVTAYRRNFRALLQT